MSFSTSSTPWSCGESITFRELLSGCRVRVKHCKDAFATNDLCPSAELGIVRVLPGTLWSLGITLTLVVKTPCVSVPEQQLKHTGKLCFWISKPKRERRGPGKRPHPPDDSLRLRVCLQQHLPSTHATRDWQQRRFLSQTLHHSPLQGTPPGCSTARAVALHSLHYPTRLKGRWD